MATLINSIPIETYDRIYKEIDNQIYWWYVEG